MEVAVSAAAAGHCRRALHYQLASAVPTEPPSHASLNRQELARKARAAAQTSLQREGWTVTVNREPTSIRPHHNVTVRLKRRTGLAHPEITAGKPVHAVIVSVNNAGQEHWQSAGIMYTHPGAYHQLAIAAEAAHHARTPVPFGDPAIRPDLAQPQMIALFNRDTGHLEYEPAAVPDLIDHATGLYERLRELGEFIQAGTAPPAEYARTSRACQRCPYLTLCHGPEPEPEPIDQEHHITHDQLDAALAEYSRIELALGEFRSLEKQRRRAMAAIKQYLQEQRQQRLRFHADGVDWNVSLSRTERPEIDRDKARTQLSATTLDAITTVKRTETLRITPAK